MTVIALRNGAGKPAVIPQMDVYRKRPVNVEAIRVMEAFEVETMEGVMRGKPGDWLIRGVAGELYPCDDAIFRKTYTNSDGSEVAP